MTDALGQSDMGSRFLAALQRVGAVLGKAGFGLFLMVAALAALVATTFIGIMLAIAAVFLTLTAPRRRKASRNEPVSQTLEARRTADGWVIEV